MLKLTEVELRSLSHERLLTQYERACACRSAAEQLYDRTEAGADEDEDRLFDEHNAQVDLIRAEVVRRMKL